MSSKSVLSTLMRGLHEQPPAQETCSLVIHGGMPKADASGAYRFPGNGEIHGDSRLLALVLASVVQACPELGRVLRVALHLEEEMRNHENVKIITEPFPMSTVSGAARRN